MSPRQLDRIARALYRREDWRHAMAAETGLARRSLARWASGAEPIPGWAALRIMELVEGAITELEEAC